MAIATSTSLLLNSVMMEPKEKSLLFPRSVASTIVFLNYLESKAKKVDDLYSGQPTMFQKFNEDKNELQTFILMQTEKDKRLVYFLDSNGNMQSQNFNDMFYKGSSTSCQNSDQIKLKYLSNTKASSTIDINGDCIPDLILESVDFSNNKNILEIYLSTSSGYCLVSLQALDDEYLMASFADLSKLLVTQTRMVPTICSWLPRSLLPTFS